VNTRRNAPDVLCPIGWVFFFGVLFLACNVVLCKRIR
jgi:hypothetical protein